MNGEMKMNGSLVSRNKETRNLRKCLYFISTYYIASSVSLFCYNPYNIFNRLHGFNVCRFNQGNAANIVKIVLSKHTRST